MSLFCRLQRQLLRRRESVLLRWTNTRHRRRLEMLLRWAVPSKHAQMHVLRNHRFEKSLKPYDDKTLSTPAKEHLRDPIVHTYIIYPDYDTLTKIMTICNYDDMTLIITPRCVSSGVTIFTRQFNVSNIRRWCHTRTTMIWCIMIDVFPGLCVCMCTLVPLRFTPTIYVKRMPLYICI